MRVRKPKTWVATTLVISAMCFHLQGVRAAGDTYLDALINIGTTLGADGLYYLNLTNLMKSAATQPVKDALAEKAPDQAWTSLRSLRVARSYRDMSDPDKNTLKQVLAKLRDGIAPVVKPLATAAAAIDTWLGEQSVGLDAIETFDDNNPERRGSVADLHKTAVVFIRTTPADSFAGLIQARPRLAANLLKYLPR
jgi:hypothetical protein